MNVNGALFTAQAAGQQMERFGRGGSITMIASVGAHGSDRVSPSRSSINLGSVLVLCCASPGVRLTYHYLSTIDHLT